MRTLTQAEICTLNDNVRALGAAVAKVREASASLGSACFLANELLAGFADLARAHRASLRTIVRAQG